MNLRRWLQPGIGVKRWLVVVFIGELLVALFGAFVLKQLYSEVTIDAPLQGAVYVLTLQFLPYWTRGVILGSLGLAVFLVGSLRLMRALTEPLREADPERPLVEVIYQKRFLARGPRLVAIGGGTGLSTLLRGLKEHTSNLTAIVAVADDGGSSGMLRAALGVPPVGDIRNCLVALADAEPLMGQLLQYRFPSAGDRSADDDPRTLAGHALGNLLITAMTAIESGDFEEGVRQMNRVLAVRGQVLPACPSPLTLHARLEDGTEVAGQSVIARTSGIERVWVTPEDARASKDALAAIAEAEVIVLGPGSLYTSLLPTLLLPDVREAVAASSAMRIYVCNVATQRGETSGYDLADHLEALERHAAAGLVDVVLGNNDFSGRAPDGLPCDHVRLRWPPTGETQPRLVLDGVVDQANARRHDPARLAAAIVRIAESAPAARRRAKAVRSA
jgi:uncharacterized cofD-like protein